MTKSAFESAIVGIWLALAWFVGGNFLAWAGYERAVGLSDLFAVAALSYFLGSYLKPWRAK
jgi:hypothetical protein